MDNLFKHTNIFGGEDIFINGKFTGSTRENLFGGNNFFDSTGSAIGSSHANVFDGTNLYSSSGEFVGSSHSFGSGESFYDGSGGYSGFISTHGDMTTAFDAAGGIDAINIGGSIFGDIGLESDELLDSLANFL